MKSVLFILLFTIRLSDQPGYAQQHTTPFTSHKNPSQNSARITGINAIVSGNKVILDWEVSENQSADLFEIEKSTDGKNFAMAALVFGTDKQETGKYEFFEKAVGNQPVSYRIKLVNKNKIAEYSKTVQAIKQ